MRCFDDILTLAAVRKGGLEPVEALLPEVTPARELENIPDDRWLAAMTKRVFQAGFNWNVVENKWPGFEAAFDGFEPERWHYMSDADSDRLLKDTRIIRHAKKILSVRDNATLICALAVEQGSAAQCFAHWPSEDYAGLLEMLKKRGSRLGGTAA
ncbi:MAG: DNA-3-methyladenine glycosylase I, partial [Gammaproteobacteria bacterium]|nr:DNA-3-methyladenine glycosylase I [Gammaproteobacteria bacterium]